VRENFIPVLDLVAEQLRYPRLDSTEFEKMKRERLVALEQNKSEPQLLASIELTRHLRPLPRGHLLYAALPDEQIQDINAVTLDQVRAFHRDYYGATFADLAVVGAIDEAEVSAAATRLFGDWRNPQPFSRAVYTYTPVDSTFVSIETPDKQNAYFTSGQNLQLRDDDPDYPAMLLAAFMTGGGFLNSRIEMRLRQKDGVSYGAFAFVSVQSFDRYGTFTGAAIHAPQNVDKVTTGYREEIDRIIAEGFTREEVEAAKVGYVQGRSQSRANDEELVGTLITRRYTGRTMVYDAELERRIMALTAEEVNAAVKKYLDPKRTVIVRAGDFAKGGTQ
jgi:zinc protease